MSKKTVLQEIQEKVKKSTEKENIQLGKEKDPVNQIKLGLQIQQKIEKIILEEIKTRSNKDFENWLKDLTKPFTERYTNISRETDDIILTMSKDSKEFENYKKIKKLKENYAKKLISSLDESNLSQKHLERYLIFMILNSAQIDLQTMQNNIEYNELARAISLVQRRLKFDHNWFTCLGLIQLHENLIKKRIIELGGHIQKKVPVEVLITEFANLLKKKENRDITLDLLMSHGLRKVRNLMTHEGFKHKVSKETLRKIIKDIESLESILYHEKFSIFNQ